MTDIKVVFFDLGDTLVHEKRWVSGARELLPALRQYSRLGVISNTGELSRDQLSDLLPPDFSFDAFEEGLVILSSEVGVEKPNPEIFKRAIACAGIPAKNCLFCSESAVDVLAAQATGMIGARMRTESGPFSSDIADLLDVLQAAGLLRSRNPVAPFDP